MVSSSVSEAASDLMVFLTMRVIYQIARKQASHQLISLPDVVGSLAQNKKGRGHKEDENDHLSRQMESLSINAEGGPSDKLPKEERRRAAAAAEVIDVHEEKGVEDPAAAAEAVKAEEEARLDMEKLAGKAGKKVEWEGGVDGVEEDDGNKRRMSKKERKKAKQQVRWLGLLRGIFSMREPRFYGHIMLHSRACAIVYPSIPLPYDNT